MKFLALQIIVLVLICTMESKSQDLSTLSIAICEVIENFYSKYTRNLVIVDFGGSNNDLIGQIMENNKALLPITIEGEGMELRRRLNKTSNQSILLFRNFQNFLDFNENYLIEMRFFNPIKFLIYFQNGTAFDISMIHAYYKLTQFLYFIVFDKNDKQIKLYTFDNDDHVDMCREYLKLYKINEFSSTTLKWIKEPIFPKKFQDFHNCFMPLAFYNSSGIFRSYSADGKFIGSKFLHDLMDVVSSHLNFVPNLIFCQFEQCAEQSKKGIYFYNFIHLDSLNGASIRYADKPSWLNVFLNIECA